MQLRRDPFILFAHRGDNRNFTENTISAFNSSLSAGYRAMELDLVRLKDGNVVVFHDDNLKRICGADRGIGDISQSEFKSIFPDLVTFDELCSHFSSSDIEINLEIKDDPETFDLIKDQAKMLKHPLISSFNADVVDRAAEAGMECAYLFNSTYSFLKRKFFLKKRRVHIPARLILNYFFFRFIFSGYDIYCYTVNDSKTVKRLMEYPFVKGVFTDRVDLRSELLSMNFHVV